VPVAALAIALAPRWLDESRERAAARSLDLPGAVSVTVGLVLLVYAPARAQIAGWLSVETLSLLILALIALVGFVAIEWRSKAPLVPLRIFRSRPLTVANLVSVLFVMALPSHIFVLTLYMQGVLGFSAFETGIAWLPHALAAFVAGLTAARVAARIGVKATLLTGMAVLMAGLLLLSRISGEGAYLSVVLPGSIATAFGIVLSFVTLTITATNGVRAEEQGLASGLVNTAQQIGVALGMAVAMMVLAARTADPALVGVESAVAVTAGFQDVLVADAGIALMAALVAALGIRDSGRSSAFLEDELTSTAPANDKAA
jgi:predicted MFS family arabinose efflux permease